MIEHEECLTGPSSGGVSGNHYSNRGRRDIMESAALLPNAPEGSGKTPYLFLRERGEPLQVLTSLCGLVVTCERPYEDVAEQIEDVSYELCEAGKLEKVIAQLGRVAAFFERIPGKNDEQCRDLADVYLLIGQIHQFAGKFNESVTWFDRAAIVDDRYPEPFHCLATSYRKLSDHANTIKSLEQELELAPGNYYSYLLLADVYEEEGRPDDVETCLRGLLERDPENMQGLHRLIRHYELTDPSIDTALLKRRLMAVNKKFNRIEAVIRSRYLCRDGKYAEAVGFLDTWHDFSNGTTITLLVKAHAFGELRQYARRKRIIDEFKQKNHGRVEVMQTKLREFASVFGEKAAAKLNRHMLLAGREK
jgi:tetratricopeptide (TPR) repeat protein